VYVGLVFEYVRMYIGVGVVDVVVVAADTGIEHVGIGE
jgi:hypothetical protein